MRNNKNSIAENVILLLVAIGVFAIIGGFAGWWSGSDDEEYYDYDYSPSSSYSSHSSSSYNSSGSSGSSSYTPKSYSSGKYNSSSSSVQILRTVVRTAIAIPVAALHIQEALQAAAPVQRNIIMIHMMMVMMMSIWMETMMMIDTTAMMIMLPV